MMKNLSLSMLAITLATLSLANLDGALPENTAAPGELTCGRQPCHNVPVNAGEADISIVFGNAETAYGPDSIYSITISIENPLTERNGFQILALNENNQNTGTWVLAEPDKMKMIPGIGLPNRRYVTHKAAGNQQHAWTVLWKAPPADDGTVTFYASVLSANDNGMNTGDEVYNTNLEVDYEEPSTVTGTKSGEPSVYPVPAVGGVWIDYPRPNGTCRLALFDNSGCLLRELELEKPGPFFLDMQGGAGGVYFLRMATQTKMVVRKIVVK